MIDGVGTERHRPIWPTNDTYLDGCASQWRQGASSARLAIEQLGALRVDSAIYPELQSYYSERVRRWVELLQREITPSGASYVTDRR